MNDGILVLIITTMLGILGYVIVDFKTRIESAVNKFASHFEHESRELYKNIHNMTETLSLVTRDVNQQLLQIKQDLINFKADIFDETKDVKEEFARMRINIDVMKGSLAVATDKYENQYKILQEVYELINKYEKSMKTYIREKAMREASK